MSWAEDAVRRVVALHTRSEWNTCQECVDSESGGQDWPCSTLEVLWDLDAVISGPRQEPIQGPQLTFRQEIERSMFGLRSATERHVNATIAAIQKDYPAPTIDGQPLFIKHTSRIQVSAEALRMFDS